MKILQARSLGCPQDPHPRLHQQAADLPAEQGLVPVLPPEPCPQSPSTGTAISLKTTVSAYGLIECGSGVIKYGSTLVAMGGFADCAVMLRFKYVYRIVRSACGVVEMGCAIIKYGYRMILC